MKPFFSHELRVACRGFFLGHTLYRRYVVGYLFRFHFISLFFLVLFVLMGQIWQFVSQWLQAGVGVLDTLHLILLLIPSAFLWAMSFSLMLGVFFTLAVLHAQGELVALWFMGLSSNKIMSPIFRYSLVMMVITLFLSHIVYPYSMDRFTRTFNQLIFEKPVIQFKDRSILWLNGRLLAVSSVQDMVLQDVILLDKTSSPMVIASAKEAQLDKNTLGQTIFVMNEPWILRIPPDPRLTDFTRLDAQTLLYPLSIKGVAESSASAGTADLISTWHAFREARQRAIMEYDDLKKRMAEQGLPFAPHKDFDFVKSSFILGFRLAQILLVPLFMLLAFSAYFYFPQTSPVLLMIGLLFFALILWLSYYLLAVVVVHGRLPLAVIGTPLLVLIGTVLYLFSHKRAAL